MKFFVKIKIYDANGNVLKSVDILGKDTGKTAKSKIENILNNVNSDSKDDAESEEIEQSKN